MKNLNKLVLVLVVCLAAPLASVFAGGWSDLSISWSYPLSVTGPDYRSGSITLPAGAIVNWEVYLALEGNAYGGAMAFGSGAVDFYASGNDIGGGSTQDGGTMDYTLYTYVYANDTYTYNYDYDYYYFNYAGGEAAAVISASW